MRQKTEGGYEKTIYIIMHSGIAFRYNRQIEKRRKSIRNAIFRAPEHSNTKSDRNLARKQHKKPSNETIIRGLPTFWSPLNIQFKLHVFLALKQAFSTLQVGLIYVDVTQKERD